MDDTLGIFVCFNIQFRILDDHGDTVADDTLLSLDKDADRLADIGRSLDESKNVLAGLQRPIVKAQLADYAAHSRCCPQCGNACWCKGS